jgi:hypothetical protein
MKGYISSWKFGNDRITSCEGAVFPFDLDGVSDTELRLSLQQSGPFSDSGPCRGRKVPVHFMVQGGFAVDIGRLQPRVSWKEF